MDSPAAIIVLSALAQPTRLDAFRLLVASEPDGIPAGDLARALGIPQNTLSTHLSILARAGLVVGERRSRQVIYRAVPSRLRDVALFLVEDCCGGRPELCGITPEPVAACCPGKAEPA